MRIGTWNCRQNFDGKSGYLASLELDVAVVPECSKTPQLATRHDVSFAWTGDYATKGLGVFAFNGWTLNVINERDPLPWCLPLEVAHQDGRSFLLIAVWTVKRARDGHPSYADQFGEVIQRWAPKFSNTDVIIAGDLNASLQGPSADAHRNNLDLLNSHGVSSAFHQVNGVTQPDDEPPTLRWIGPGKKQFFYHCDYIFTTMKLAENLKTAKVGSLSDWIESGLSDHCPVVAEFSCV